MDALYRVGGGGSEATREWSQSQIITCIEDTPLCTFQYELVSDGVLYVMYVSMVMKPLR